jgi:hypothetical protein
MAESSGDETAIRLVFTNFKDDLVHGLKVSRAGSEREVWFTPLFLSFAFHILPFLLVSIAFRNCERRV